MNLAELKNRFRHKRKADISDIDLALQAVPFLVRTVEHLETELKDAKDRIAQLNQLLNKRPSLSKEGVRGEGRWNARVDEEKNRFYLSLSGYFDYQSAKVASNHIIAVLANLREGADAVNDLRELKGVDKRALFHLRKIIYTLDYMGVHRVVRLAGGGEATQAILKVMYPHQADYDVSIARTVEEADAILDNSRKFLKA